MIYRFLFFQEMPVFAHILTLFGEQIESKTEKSKVLTRSGITN